MTAATVLQMPIKTKLVCSACGAQGEGSCRCGVPYVSPGERAKAAVKANPEKSDRAIAEAIGVSDMTVARARKRTSTNVAVGKRTGRDGKSRKQPKRRPKAAPTKVGAAQRKIAKEAAVAPVPMSRQINLMTGELSDFLSAWCHSTKEWAEAHRQQLEDERPGEDGWMTGKSTLIRSLTVSANQLLQLAQALDGR